MTYILLNDFNVHPPSLQDAQKITDLIIHCDTEEFGEPNYTLDDVLQKWKREGFNLLTDAWVIYTQDGKLIAYADIVNLRKTQIPMAAYVHSEYRAKGIGTYLLQQMQQRALQELNNTPPGTRVTLNTFISINNPAAQTLLEKNDYQEVRRYWRMQLEMKTPPPEVNLPAGFQIRTFIKGQDEHTVYEALEESFSDNWGHVIASFEEWKARSFSQYDFNPDLWFLTTEGNEIVGCSLCGIKDGKPWVNTLGVRRKWRGKGVAKALLRYSFNKFYQQGYRIAYLGVDSQNLSGATHLYFSVGLKKNLEGIRFEKEIRAGKEIRVQGL